MLKLKMERIKVLFVANATILAVPELNMLRNSITLKQMLRLNG